MILLYTYYFPYEKKTYIIFKPPVLQKKERFTYILRCFRLTIVVAEKCLNFYL